MPNKPRGRLRVVAAQPSPIEKLNSDLMGIATMFEVFARNAIPLQVAVLPADAAGCPGEAPTRAEVAQLVLSIGILRIGLEEFEHSLGAYARTMPR